MKPWAKVLGTISASLSFASGLLWLNSAIWQANSSKLAENAKAIAEAGAAHGLSAAQVADAAASVAAMGQAFGNASTYMNIYAAAAALFSSVTLQLIVWGGD
jgi:hypothetical protein